MGDFVALARLDDSPPEPGVLRPAAERLRSIASDERRRDLAIDDESYAALQWATSHDARSWVARGFEPSHPSLPEWLLFDGRLDDRDALISLLAGRVGPEATRSAAVTDARLVRLGFAILGEELFDQLVGPFAMAVWSAVDRTLCFARDPLGGRTIYTRHRAFGLAFASRPSLLLRLGDDAVRENEETIARYLAIRGPRPGATFYRGIEELPAGVVRLILPDGSVRERHLSLCPAPTPGRGADRDFEERFRELLDRAVGARLGRGNVAVLMSGGLDSTAVAATAARLGAGAGSPPPLTISWVFRELPGSDERRWIEPANRRSGALQRLIWGDDAWPLSDEPSWPSPNDAPAQDAYWRLYESASAIAKSEGAEVLLTGDSGDLLWAGGRDWLRDLVRTVRLVEAGASAIRAFDYMRQGQPIAHPLRASLGRLLRRSPWGPAPEREVPWLTAEGQALAERNAEPGLASPPWTAERFRFEKLVNPLDLSLLSSTRRQIAGLGIEVRRPYRDRRMVEFFLGLPAHLMYRPGESKRLLRRALVDRLPGEVLQRRTTTSLLPLFDRGMLSGAGETARAILTDSEAIWPRFVRPEWLWGHAFPSLGSAPDGVERVVLWNCLCLERWRRGRS